MNACARTFKQASLLFLASFLFLGWGCTPKKPATDAGEPAPYAALKTDSMDVDSAYEEGLHAFWIGNYKMSTAVFERLARRQEDQASREKALYALACSRLAGAETADDLKNAQAAWKDWEQASTGSAFQADPHMLDPFIQNSKISVPGKDPREAKPLLTKSAGDQDLAKRLQEKEKEVLLLQKQIKALEAIHREIQEKKKLSNQ